METTSPEERRSENIRGYHRGRIALRREERSHSYAQARDTAHRLIAQHNALPHENHTPYQTGFIDACWQYLRMAKRNTCQEYERGYEEARRILRQHPTPREHGRDFIIVARNCHPMSYHPYTAGMVSAARELLRTGKI